MKNTLQGINSGVNKADDQISNFEDKEHQSEQQKFLKIQNMRIV